MEGAEAPFLFVQDLRLFPYFLLNSLLKTFNPMWITKILFLRNIWNLCRVLFPAHFCFIYDNNQNLYYVKY